MTAAPDALAALRARLTALRDDALRQLANGEALDGGLLHLLAGVGAALDGLDGVPVDPQPADRLIVADDGETIRLDTYRGAERPASVEVSPLRAIALAGALIAAAVRRLGP
jgi:hypothetical protein